MFSSINWFISLWYSQINTSQIDFHEWCSTHNLQGPFIWIISRNFVSQSIIDGWKVDFLFPIFSIQQWVTNNKRKLSKVNWFVFMQYINKILFSFLLLQPYLNMKGFSSLWFRRYQFEFCGLYTEGSEQKFVNLNWNELKPNVLTFTMKTLWNTLLYFKLMITSFCFNQFNVFKLVIILFLRMYLSSLR